ncbi:hypothetical protein FKP32DRAFT_1728144 [Trametes sanguinea]|nr:hypothetical protein FKP32DRAFT_1728144 [Trametes sanguinea]
MKASCTSSWSRSTLAWTSGRPSDVMRMASGLLMAECSARKALSRNIEKLRDLGRRFLLATPHFGSWPDDPFRNSSFSVDAPSHPFPSDADFHRYFLNRLKSKYSDTPTYRA